MPNNCQSTSKIAKLLSKCPQNCPNTKKFHENLKNNKPQKYHFFIING